MHPGASPDAGNQNLESVSCVSSTFCVAADQSGFYTTWNGTSWSTMAPFDGFSIPGGQESVSCLSTALCVASGADGYAEVYNGTGWSAPRQLDSHGLGSSSCAQASANLPPYCAISTSEAVYYMENQGGTVTWSAAQSVPNNNADAIRTLGCAVSLCMATGAENHAWEGGP
jgi:hypothetical protein